MRAMGTGRRPVGVKAAALSLLVVGWLFLVNTRFTPGDAPLRPDGCAAYTSVDMCVASTHDSEQCVWCCSGDCGRGYACEPAALVPSVVRFEGPGGSGCSLAGAGSRLLMSESEAVGPPMPVQQRAVEEPPQRNVPVPRQPVRQLRMVDGVGCLDFDTKQKCLAHRDGRSDYKHFAHPNKIYEEPCIWCCGESCIGDEGALCEPRQYALNAAGFNGAYESGSENKCRGRGVSDPLYVGDVSKMTGEQKEEAIRRLRRVVPVGGPQRKPLPTDFLSEAFPGFDDGKNGMRPRLPPGARPMPRGQRPQPQTTEWGTPLPPDPPMFDMQLSEGERAAAVTARVAELKSTPLRSKSDAQELGALRMMQRRWQDARDAFETARTLDPSDGHSSTLLGYALEGMRYSDSRTAPPPSESDIRRVFDQAGGMINGTTGATAWGNDTHFVDCHHGCDGKRAPRPWPQAETFRKAASETVADAVAYYEVLRIRGGLAQPQFRTLSFSTGSEPWEVAGSVDETVERFEKSDVVILRGLLPPFVVRKVAAYYARFSGKCHHFGKGKPLKCDPPEIDVFGRNPNDPHVHNAYSDRVGFWLNQFLRPLAQAVAGRRLNPTYSYLARYLDKPDGLQAHTDQVDNEYTMSIQIQYTPEDQGPCPIYVHKKRLEFYEYARNVDELCPHKNEGKPFCTEPGDSIGGALELGDAVLFRGRQHIHFRPRWEKGRTCMSIINHFGPREIEEDRGQHNVKVCCAWPPLPDHNMEDCECPDSRKRRAKQGLKRLMPLR